MLIEDDELVAAPHAESVAETGRELQPAPLIQAGCLHVGNSTFSPTVGAIVGGPHHSAATTMVSTPRTAEDAYACPRQPA